MTSTNVLTVSNASKSYRGVHALKNVDFELRHAEIHALCGENGAGKSTLVRLISGLAIPDEGEIHVDGTPLKYGQRTSSQMVSVVYQELSIVPDLSVLENVLLGDPRIGWAFSYSKYKVEVRDLLDRMGLNDVPLSIAAGKLTVAERQLLEICRAVLRRSRVLILDEPTASLSDVEIARVFETARWLRKNGTAVIYISHRLPEIFALTDRITVFRNGRRILTKDTSEWTSSELVREMIGREIHETGHDMRCDTRRVGAPAVEVSDLRIPGKLAPLNMSVAQGEVLGVIGQLGSGASTIVETLAGLERRYEGKISVSGVQADLRNQPAAIKAGIAYVTEDRGAKSLFKGASVQQNLIAANLSNLCRVGFIDTKAVGDCAGGLAKRFQVDSAKLVHDISTLSGGNQQKVAIAKSVAVGPKVLLLNEPTRGVDVGARTEIYRELRALAAEGVTIIFFSTDLEEVKELSDRVLTVFKGKVVSDRPIHEMNSDSILSDILNGNTDQEAAA